MAEPYGSGGPGYDEPSDRRRPERVGDGGGGGGGHDVITGRELDQRRDGHRAAMLHGVVQRERADDVVAAITRRLVHQVHETPGAVAVPAPFAVARSSTMRSCSSFSTGSDRVQSRYRSAGSVTLG